MSLPDHYDNLSDDELIDATKHGFATTAIVYALAERLAMRNRDLLELTREHMGLYNQYLILDGENHGN